MKKHLALRPLFFAIMPIVLIILFFYRSNYGYSQSREPESTFKSFMRAILMHDIDKLKNCTTYNYYNQLEALGSWDVYAKVWPIEFEIKQITVEGRSSKVSITAKSRQNNRTIADYFILTQEQNQWKVSEGGKGIILDYMNKSVGE